jgi:hypothetical protein
MRPFVPAEVGQTAWWHLHRKSVVDLLIAAVLIAVLVMELVAFARVQDLWLDESTQLSGITLKFWEMLHWLIGGDQDPDRLGVPADRMPPVSYILDWLWLHFHGPSVLGFRLFHSAFLIAGITCLAAAQWRELGRSAMFVSLGFLVLSPKLIQAGVEIRAYPIFFALSCVQTAVFLRLIASRSKIDWKLPLLFAAICLVTVYAHFYGVVSSCAFFLALGLASLRRPAVLARIMGAFAVVAAGSAPLWLFISGAAQVPLFVPATATAPSIADTSFIQYPSYLLKLVGDVANIISPPASILFFAGTITLVGASAFAAGMRAREGNPRTFDWLLLVVIAGVFATVAAGFVVKTFDALKPSYSVWLMAPIGLLVGAGAVSNTGARLWDGMGRRAAAGAMLLGAGISTYLFLQHASVFVHGPQGFIGALYDKAKTPKAIVYEPGAAWGWSFIPLQYSHRGQVLQYRPQDDGTDLLQAVGGRRAAPKAQELVAAVAPYRVLLLTDIRLRTYRDLRQCQNQPSECPEFPSGAIEAALIGTGKWRKVDRERKFGLYDSQVTILERSDD